MVASSWVLLTTDLSEQTHKTSKDVLAAKVHRPPGFCRQPAELWPQAACCLGAGRHGAGRDHAEH